MSHDSETALTFQAMRLHRQQKGEKMAARNRFILKQSGLTYEDRGNMIMFREPGKPSVNVYPTKGTWMVSGERTLHRGGMRAFLFWYQRECG